jgi:gliding motility-associated-like protein
VNVDAAQCNFTQTGSAWNAIATDNCTVSTTLATLSGATTASGLTTLVGVDFNIGTTTVLWTVTDGVGNVSTCTFDVTVVDNISPSISSCGAAGNQTINVDAAQCNFTQTGTAWNATATDNCTVSTIIASLSGATTASGLTTLAGVDFNLGTTTVLWTVTDGSGKTSTCTFDVTVVDNILPSITSCGATGNQTVNVDAAQCDFTQTGTAWNATATDNCTVSSIVATLSGATTASGLTTLAGVDFNIGTTTVLWTVTDGVGNSSSCTFDVTVVDNVDPTILSCGATGAQVVSSDLGVCTYTQTSNSWDAVASDNCTIGSISYSLSGATSGSGTSLAGVTFNSGITTVLWTAVDGSMNTSTCSFTVEVEDNQAPIISGCPTNLVVGTDNGVCGAIVNWSVPTFTDNCGAAMTSNYNSGQFFPTGTSTVIYTVTDAVGNTSICSFTITVNDNELPTLACPAPIESCDPLVVYAAPVFGDNCGTASTFQTAGLPSGMNFPVGMTMNAFQTTDIHGNVSTCTFSVTIFALPVASTDVTDVSCFGLNDGEIDLTITSGTAPFTYTWSNSQSSEDLIGLAPGTYTVSVIDDHGCSTTASAEISEPEVLQLSAEFNNVNCYNGNDGLIDLNVSGGTLPYSFTWSNGAITEDLSGLSAGPYDVVVSDFNGCEISYNTTITQPDSLMIAATVIDANCGTANGTILIQVTGGNAPYQFAWTNGTTEMSLYNVVAGTYTLIVTDAMNCTNSYTGTVSTISSLNANLIEIDAKCFGENSGSIQAVVSSGFAPFTYDWSDGQTSPTAIDLTAGTYSVTITDMYGCQVTLNGTVNQPDSLYAIVTSSVYAGGYNISSNNGSDGYLNTQVFGGTSPYSFNWTGPSNFASTNQNLANLQDGAYALYLTDVNGCAFSTSSRLTEPALLEMPNGYSPNGDGDNETFVVHGIDAYPNNEIVVFNRWGNIVYKKANYANEWAGDNTVGEALPDGTYFVILTVVAGEEEITLKGYVDLRR